MQVVVLFADTDRDAAKRAIEDALWETDLVPGPMSVKPKDTDKVVATVWVKLKTQDQISYLVGFLSGSDYPISKIVVLKNGKNLIEKHPLAQGALRMPSLSHK